MFDLEPHKVASILVWVTSLSGMFSNGVVFCWVTKMPSMQNPFGRIARNQSLTGFLHACGYFFFFAPMLYFDIKAWKDPKISSWFGQLEDTFYDACLYCHLFISLNRIISIWFPMYYDLIFTKNRVRLINFLVWAVAIGLNFYFLRWADCRIQYGEEVWGVVFLNTELCFKIGMAFVVHKGIILTMIIAFLDMCTFLKCRVHGRQLLRLTTDTQARNRKIMEITFVTQSFVQAFIFILELLTYFVFVNWTDSKLAKFALKTIAWIMVHSLDGFIAILFNKEFIRKVFISKQRRVASDYRSSQVNTTGTAAALTIHSVAIDIQKK
ncbi:unnamed protein product, partial [Mesorhabditis spiculigera]